MEHTISYINATGGTYYAFPTSQSLTAWTTYRVFLNEGTGDNTCRYSGTVDSDNGEDWAVFEGATQPASWNVAEEVLSLSSADAATNAAAAATQSTAGAASAATAATQATTAATQAAEIKAKTDLIGTLRSLIKW